MPLVLTSNEVILQEVAEWKDITGVQYHYPNVYRNKIKSGEAFLYYRGSRRPGNLRAVPEYFGCGIIGNIWRDETIPIDAPKRHWQWYCAIDRYIPFPSPVPFKINGVTYEEIKHQNLWGVGLREISQAVHDRIVLAAGLVIETVPDLKLPEPHLSRMQEGQCLIATKRRDKLFDSSGGEGRYSKIAKQTGDRGEKLVLEWIRKNLTHTNLRWVASFGEKPGWDIEYYDEFGNHIAVEVKASVSRAFTNFEVTRNELLAAQDCGKRYWFYFVTDCFGQNPVLQRMQASELGKTLQIEPVRWEVSLSPSETHLL